MTLPQKLLRIIILAVAVLPVCFGCNSPLPDYPSHQPPPGLFKDPVQAESGQKLFREKCASCHGKPEEGRSERAVFFEPPAPVFSEDRYRNIDPAYLYWRIDVGKTVEPYRSQGSVMPAWGAYLSDQQIWQLVAYLVERAG